MNWHRGFFRVWVVLSVLWIAGSWLVTKPLLQMQTTFGSYHIFTVYNQDIAFPVDTPRSVVDHNLTDFAQALRKKTLGHTSGGLTFHKIPDDETQGFVPIAPPDETQGFVPIAPPGMLMFDQAPGPALAAALKASNNHFFVRDKPASWRPPPEDVAAANEPEPEVAAALKDYEPYSRPAVIFAAWGPIVLPPIGLMAAALVGMWVMRGFIGEPRLRVGLIVAAALFAAGAAHAQSWNNQQQFMYGSGPGRYATGSGYGFPPYSPPA